MMKALTSTKFEKEYKRLPTEIQEKFKERVRLFLSNPQDPLLNIHKLRGGKEHLKSMNVTGDYRALFTQEDKNTVIFSRIGTHSQLY